MHTTIYNHVGSKKTSEKENKMKTEQLLIRLSTEELTAINIAFKKAMLEDESTSILTRSEFIRSLIKLGLESKGAK